MINKIKAKLTKKNLKNYAGVAGAALVSSVAGIAIGRYIMKEEMLEDISAVENELETFKVAYYVVGLANMEDYGGDIDIFNDMILDGQRMISRLNQEQLNTAWGMDKVSEALKYMYVLSKSEGDE